MAKITRKKQKVFALNASNTGQFGSAQAGSQTLSTDPDVIQQLTAWSNGWNDAVISGEDLPTLEEMQGIQYVVTRQLGYLLQEGIAEYDVGTEYHANSIVKKPATYELYGSIINTNVGNALGSQADNANWKYLGDLAGLVNAGATGFQQNFRLSLVSGNPTADATSASTIYCTPYIGNKISLYTGSAWVTRATSEFSLALGTLIASRNYDVFAWDNAGVPTLEFTAWTNDTTRATGLVYQDGIKVKSGALTRRYLGTFRTLTTTTTSSDTANRLLINYYNRITLDMKRQETTASWTYTNTTVRQANANTANQLNFLATGEDTVNAYLRVATQNTAASIQVLGGIGLDSTSTYTLGAFDDQITVAANKKVTSKSSLVVRPSEGFHFLSWNESGEASGTQTWYGAGSNNCLFLAEVKG